MLPFEDIGKIGKCEFAFEIAFEIIQMLLISLVAIDPVLVSRMNSSP